LIIALDRPSLKESLAVLDRLPDSIRYVKVGLELFIAEGPEALRILRMRNKKIFLDLKLHDIPNTVARAVTTAARHGVAMLTLHACGGRAMLSAAKEAARTCGAAAPKLIAVTALTSLGPSDLPELGIQRTLPDQVMALGELALSSGIDGLVCSVHETALLRQKFGADPILITPGIRPTDDAAGDQKRVATPAMAVKAGSSFLVVGRPILDAPDSLVVANAILREMVAAQAARPA
jgi:orotidine-5'-phosphate decarboxylase